VAFAEIGHVYGKTAAQVTLRWIIQKGMSINTMSTKPDTFAPISTSRISRPQTSTWRASTN